MTKSYYDERMEEARKDKLDGLGRKEKYTRRGLYTVDYTNNGGVVTSYKPKTINDAREDSGLRRI